MEEAAGMQERCARRTKTAGRARRRCWGGLLELKERWPLWGRARAREACGAAYDVRAAASTIGEWLLPYGKTQGPRAARHCSALHAALWPPPPPERRLGGRLKGLVPHGAGTLPIRSRASDACSRYGCAQGVRRARYDNTRPLFDALFASWAAASAPQRQRPALCRASAPAACRGCRCGGLSSASGRSGSPRASRSRTGARNE